MSATKSSSPTPKPGSTSLPPSGDSFMYIETSQKNFGNDVLVTFQRTFVIQTSNIKS